MRKEHHIPQIHNYCDRWCDRCPMIARCSIYDPKSMDPHGRSEEDSQQLWEEVAKNFQRTMEMLKEEAEKHGMDWDRLVEEAKTVEMTQPAMNPVESETIKLAEKYRVDAMDWLSDELNEQRIKAFEEQLISNIKMGIINSRKTAFRVDNALDILYWYVTMIEPKLNRALTGLHNDSFEDEDFEQSDANGSAKITMICIDRSMGAWEKIRTEIPEMADELLDHLATLSKLRKNLELIFPHHEAFLRPGFDTLGVTKLVNTQNPNT